MCCRADEAAADGDQPSEVVPLLLQLHDAATTQWCVTRNGQCGMSAAVNQLSQMRCNVGERGSVGLRQCSAELVVLMSKLALH